VVAVVDPGERVRGRDVILAMTAEKITEGGGMVFHNSLLKFI
jgi:hypothetical protein